MKQSEFIRWLQRGGYKVLNGTRHAYVIRPQDDKKFRLPRHPGAELSERIRRDCLKFLGE